MSEKDYWFISHSSKDIKIIEQLINILKNCGILYWKAPEMIPAGSNYAREIPKAIKDCNIFLFVVSEASQNSIWVEKEVDIAINYRKKVIPVRIDEISLNDMYRFYLNNIQTIDISVQPNGQIPIDAQKKLHSIFMQNTVQNDDWKKNIRTLTLETNTPKIDTRSNAFRINKIPMQCEQCGTQLQDIGSGIYKCVKCGKEHYDDFRKIRNFLEQNGPAPAIVISKSVGVSTQTIEHYFKDDAKVIFSGNTLTMQPKTDRGVWHYNHGKNNLDNRK